MAIYTGIKYKIFAICVLICLIFACSGNNKKIQGKKEKIYTDVLQRQVDISGRPKRIVSMAPSITEMLFSIGSGNEVVGVTNYCDYPEEAKNKTSIGGYFTPNTEAVLSLKPDLVISTPESYSRNKVNKLETTGLKVFFVNPKNIDEIMETMLTLGKITGNRDKSKKVVGDLKNRVNNIREKVALIPRESRPKLFYEIGHDPIITAGSGTFVDNIITEAGGINIASDIKVDWPKYSVEAIISKEPDIIITAPHTSTADESKLEKRIDAWLRFKTIPAVKNNRIYPLDTNTLLRPGPRIVDGLEAMHAIVIKFWKENGR